VAGAAGTPCRCIERKRFGYFVNSMTGSPVMRVDDIWYCMSTVFGSRRSNNT
jgi:hypothetical protein